MNTKKRYQQECAICIAVPQVPKILPCQHIYCVACLDHYIDNRMRPSEDDDDEDTGKLMCPQCRRPFSCLPKPEFGCEPIGQVHQDFTSDSFLNCAQHCGVIDKVKFKVMGLAVLGDHLYVVYHKQSTIHMYNTTAPYQLDSVADTNVLKWPRGMVASRTRQSLYVTDWNSMFAGRIWCISKKVTQFRVLSELDVQPFGISYNEESDLIVVTCSTPLRHAVPFISKSSQLLVFQAQSGQLKLTIQLDSSYEIPRHALAVGSCFVVCHGWLKHGQVVLVDEYGHQTPGCYGSHVKSGLQSLYRPLSLYDAGENHFLVADYLQHRIHLVTHQLQFVRHLVARGDAADKDTCSGCSNDDGRGVTYPRQICLHDGVLYIGTESGTIGIYRVQ